MSDQQQKEKINLQSCKRLQALAAYRQSENDLFEAISVLNDALFYLNPKGFTSPCQHAQEARKLKIDIWIKQVELCLGLRKPRKAISTMQELIKSSGSEAKVLELKRKLLQEGVKEEQLRGQLSCP